MREGVVIFLDKVNVHLISVGRPCSAGIQAMFSTDPVCSLGQNNLLVIGHLDRHGVTTYLLCKKVKVTHGLVSISARMSLRK